MRTLYQASPWKAASTPVFRSFAFDRHVPERLGDPSGFFSKAPFIPTRPVGVPIMGGVNRSLVLAKERGGAELGQACSKPTAGGSGSAEFGAGDGAAGDSTIGTIAVVGVVGVGALFLLGVI
jgi:hypothetical protein